MFFQIMTIISLGRSPGQKWMSRTDPGSQDKFPFILRQKRRKKIKKLQSVQKGDLIHNNRINDFIKEEKDKNIQNDDNMEIKPKKLEEFRKERRLIPKDKIF